MNTKALLEPMGSWAWWRSWFLIFLGCSVMGAGFVLFVNPYKFVPGGVSVSYTHLTLPTKQVV